MNKAVIGMTFGDEGKGMFTDYLCSLDRNSMVVRFSGGHQCGHTVVKDRIRHIFSNFGSGTLRGIPTYWSEQCTVEPIGLMVELSFLLKKKVTPLIYINEKCPVTTPFEIASNRRNTSNLIHGSCGVGFGATIERESKNFSLTFLDLFYPKMLKEKLRLIQKFYKYSPDFKLDEFLNYCENITNSIHICPVSNRPKNKNYVYEGSQGMLLDQNYGFFPNVTRSNTGTKNLPDEEFEIFLVTRAYQTRHGNGFMTNEEIPFEILNDPLETNVTHDFQGKFRKSMLDVSLLEYAMRKDYIVKNSSNKRLVITCLDHIGEYKFTYNDQIITCDDKYSFLNKIASLLNIKTVYFSSNSDSNYVKILSNKVSVYHSF